MSKYKFNVDDVSVEAVFNRLGGVEGARRFLRGELTLTEDEEAPLLSFVRMIRTTSAKPTIVYKSDQFKDWFDGIKPGERAQELTLRKIERQSPDTSILTALGGEKLAEVSWADFEAVLAEKGHIDDLVTLIGYVKDKNGVLRVVRASWRGGGWNVYAYSLSSYEWFAGNQVLSRN